MEITDRRSLLGIGYSVPRSCDLCEFSQFGSNQLGRCLKNDIVVHKSGSCVLFIASEIQLIKLGAFREFTEFPS